MPTYALQWKRGSPIETRLLGEAGVPFLQLGEVAPLPPSPALVDEVQTSS